MVGYLTITRIHSEIYWKKDSPGYHCSYNLSFCQKNSAYHTWYSSHCVEPEENNSWNGKNIKIKMILPKIIWPHCAWPAIYLKNRCDQSIIGFSCIPRLYNKVEKDCEIQLWNMWNDEIAMLHQGGRKQVRYGYYPQYIPISGQ